MSCTKQSMLNDEQDTAFAKESSGLWVTPRSWLFVPATRPERFDKAANSGADAVIIDLEDAVESADKPQAREHIAEYVAQYDKRKTDRAEVALNSGTTELWLRLNNDAHLTEDLVLCQSLAAHEVISGIVLPKVTKASQVELVFESLKLPVVAQIESAQGISQLEAIAQSEGLMALSYGRLDISNELDLTAGSQAEQDFFTHLRIQIRLVSQAHNLTAPIESIYADFKNETAMKATAGYVSDLGFSGMLCIHPRQVNIANQAFKASDSQLAFATKVIEHYQKTGDSTFAIEGVMVDLPVILQCQRLLQQS
ncbi:Malyl-CoA lyase [Psychrobacter pasteurii]|uniref:Malyl-CoA lyase n=1 Tax=Psychrobacter pasteurii TaxID=1945520 RepID=A0A1R4EG14_9GAMM|nr:CoA ester lyase [Psychrobacter pasteurii]SJM37339.1 Malyl-CoA lyase [Psychrobacter pasteurii]